MNDTIELREYEPTELELDSVDVDWFLGPGKWRFSLTPIPRSKAWELSPGPTVGVAQLPSGRRLHCAPKARVRNVFFMLATALDLGSPFLDQPLHFERMDEIFDFLVEHLANLIDARIATGLYRSYIEREDNLRAVRGRIVIAEDVRQNAIMRHRTYCQFSEFTWDIPENRVIRQTVYVMSRLVQRSDLQRRLSALDRALGEIDPSPLPLSVFEAFDYHRLNEDYRPIHRLCRLLLESASVSEHTGDIGFRAFLLNMNRLYESFLTAALNNELSAPYALLGQRSTTLDQAATISIRPDLTLMRSAQTVLIADAKYKLRSIDDSIHADLYQILAYCTAENVHRGTLIYPAWEHAGRGTIRIRNSPIVIDRETIDLGGSIPTVRAEIDRIARGLVASTQMASPPASQHHEFVDAFSIGS